MTTVRHIDNLLIDIPEEIERNSSADGYFWRVLFLSTDSQYLECLVGSGQPSISRNALLVSNRNLGAIAVRCNSFSVSAKQKLLFQAIDPINILIGKSPGKVICYNAFRMLPVSSIFPSSYLNNFQISSESSLSVQFVSFIFEQMTGVRVLDKGTSTYGGVSVFDLDFDKQWSCQYWSTSICGKLFFPSDSKFVNIFPKINNYGLNSPEANEYCYLITAIDAQFGTFIRGNKDYIGWIVHIDCDVDDNNFNCNDLINNGHQVFCTWGQSDEDSLCFVCGDKSPIYFWLYLQMLNASIVTMAKNKPFVDSIDAIDIAIDKFKLSGTGVDVSGHLIQAARLPLYQVEFYLYSVMFNLLGVFDGSGIYKWSDRQGHGGLPVGRWHNVDDYIVAISTGSKIYECGAVATASLDFMRSRLESFSVSFELIAREVDNFLMSANVFNYYSIIEIINSYIL